MATGDPVAPTSDQVTTTPTADGSSQRIPLPPPTPAPLVVSESHLRKVRFLDGFLVLLVLVFAFLCASFRATNSDVFQHFAVGRLIAQGAFTFGSDPFTFAAEGTWVNHAWLYDLIVYLIYSLGDWTGFALVVLKALVIVATAELMLRTSAVPGQRLWIPVVCTMIAVLALSPRALLQPHVLSMAFLALTLFLLTRPASSRIVWLLPALCLLWVNVDVWFFLGPLTILLYLAGEAIQRNQRPADARPLSQLAAVCGASFVACLLNPYHVKAFLVLPVGLIRSADMMAWRDEGFRGFFITPFEQIYLTPMLGLSAAGIAYYVLLGLSIISFALTIAWNVEGLRVWRVLVWLATALLSASNIRAIPYFAVVVAPITALNFLELTVKFLGAEPRPERSWQSWAVSGRVLTAFVSIGLVLACIPGWLQSVPHHRRQVAWGIEVDPGLRDAALLVHQWQTDGLIAPGQSRWFNTSPEVSGYFAWFCPGEQVFSDGRLELYSGAVKDYSAARRSLIGLDLVANKPDAPMEPAWREVFTRGDVKFVVFYSSDLASLSHHQAMNMRLHSNPDEFAPCFIGGSTAIFAWRDPRPGRGKSIDSRLRLDVNKEAFGSQARLAPGEVTRVAGAGPWWQRVLETTGPTPSEALTAIQQVMRFNALSMRYQFENEQVYFGTLAALLTGTGATPEGPLAVLLPWRLVISFDRSKFPQGDQSAPGGIAMRRFGAFLQDYDSGPVASLYVAIREARAALAKNPDDVVAQVYLAQAYNLLYYRTREQAMSSARRGQAVPQVRLIRQAQVAAALQSVLKVNPRDEDALLAHNLLAEAFQQPEYFEVYAKHKREAGRLLKKIGPMSEAQKAGFIEGLKEQEKQLKELDKELQKRRQQFEFDAYKFPREAVLQRADVAMRQGLPEAALKLLTEADPKLLRDPKNPREAPGVVMTLTLLLGLGRLDEAREILTGDPKSETPLDSRAFGTHPLGLPAYDWFQAQLGAASGDYDKADKHLAACLEPLTKGQQYSIALAQLGIVPGSMAEQEGNAATFSAWLAGHVLLNHTRNAARLPWHQVRQLPGVVFLRELPYPLNWYDDVLIQEGRGFLLDQQQRQSDLWTLRGWLALEAGRVKEAQEHVDKALALGELGVDEQGQRMFAAFSSRWLGLLVRELARNEGTRN